ncbi:MAG: Rpn family recombination-promoting nuclease/putative transposase, partial [Desulfobacteraceae bacterium]|nr:Rpn family recombination-promoting nuclease/putative transposase [Desulfobacteraceae bacterium]
MDEIINPHDKLFRETWSDLATAKSFLQHYLPPPVLSLTALDTLEICKDTFVEKDLSEFFFDLLYKVELSGAEGFIYILFEHKSYKDRLTPLQLLEYMLKIWRLCLKQDNLQRLPIIIPLVLYHGPSSRTQINTRFSSLLDGPIDALAAYVPDFSYVLYDLTRFSDEQIKGTVMARVAMLLFKHIFDPHARDKLPTILSLLLQLMEKQTVPQYFETVFRYIISNIDDISVDDLTQIVKESLSEKQGDVVMTLAEKLRKEGYDKGVQQGMQQGLIEGIEVAVSVRFSRYAFRIMPLMYQMKDTHLLKTLKS